MPRLVPLPDRVRAALLFAALGLSAAPALAADPGGPSHRPGEPSKAQNGKDGGKDEVDTENLFGFTEGTDTGKKGDQEVTLDTILGVGRRRAGPGPSDYAAAQTTLSYQYGLTDDLTIEPGVLLDTRRTRNIANSADKLNGVVDGASLELKYQLHKRTDEAPFGLAIQLQPQWQRVQPDTGIGADIFHMDARLMADVRLIPDRLWFGTNLIYEPEVGPFRGTRQSDQQSNLTWSGTLTTRLTKEIFMGAEVRYARAYNGPVLNQFVGQAVFLGPTLTVQVEDKAFLTLAYSAQVAGSEHTDDGTKQNFELSDFSRHTVRVRFGVQF
jgi:hypothetical protein